MSPVRFRSAFVCPLILSIGCVLCSGCLHVPTSGSLSTLVGSSTRPEPPAATANCTVEIRSSARRSKTVDVPLGPETRVQDALDISKASRKFRNLNVYILRPTPAGPEANLKMVCRFDRKNRRISLESDYAVHPGDRIVVSEDHSSPIEEAVSSVLGNF